MLATITLLTALVFAVFYPVCFLISFDDPLRQNFHKFHLGLPNTVGGIVLVFLWFMDIPLSLKITATIWKAVFISISSYSWKKEYPNPKLILFPIILGAYVFLSLQAHFIQPGWTAGLIGVLSGLIFCAALYAMNLGHWYLNVHGLPIKHLKRSVNVLWTLLALRALWDVYFLLKGSVIYRGDLLRLWQFVGQLDGFLLMIGLFFGTMFPLIALYFVREVIRLKNTQSATGMLYVLLCAILIGDITYKYYLIKYGLCL